MRAAATASIGGALVGAALVGAFMYHAQIAAGDEARAQSEERVRETADLSQRSAELERQLASERRRAQQAERAAAELRMQLEAAATELAAATEELVAATEATAPAAEPRDYPVFRPEGLEEALAEIDWDAVATSMSSMPPLIDELAAALAEGRPQSELPPETIGAMQRHNGALVAAAMGLAQRGVAGTEVNSAFTHPGFMSNAIVATLVALEMPLTAEQRAALERVTLDYSVRESRRVAAYDDTTYAVEKLLDESRLKRAYFDEVYGVLTTAQHDAMRPESVRGRTQLDIFGAGTFWAGHAGPVLVQDRAELAAKVSRWLTRRADIAEGQQPRAQEIIDAWAADLPELLVATEPDALVQAGMLRVEHVEESGTRVLALLRTLDAELDLDAAGRGRLRAVPATVVIYSRLSEDR